MVNWRKMEDTVNLYSFAFFWFFWCRWEVSLLDLVNRVDPWATGGNAFSERSIFGFAKTGGSFKIVAAEALGVACTFILCWELKTE